MLFRSHAIEFLNRRYKDIFPILTSYPELENYLSPFMDAWLGGAAEQLMGQIASAKIPLSRMISPQLYWVMSDSEFTLDINNPEEPKILCVGDDLLPTNPVGNADDFRTDTVGVQHPAEMGRCLGEVADTLSDGAFLRGDRSEERRVGKECRSRWSPYH